MPSIRDLLRAYLKELKYNNVSEVSNGREALQFMIASQAVNKGVQIVIADWNMPELNGLELLKEIRKTEEWRKLPYILLTSESEKTLVTQAIIAGVNQYIVKPFSQKIIKTKLDSVWSSLHK